jgi:hypothetical protein
MRWGTNVTECSNSLHNTVWCKPMQSDHYQISDNSHVKRECYPSNTTPS